MVNRAILPLFRAINLIDCARLSQFFVRNNATECAIMIENIVIEQDLIQYSFY